jgi:predicted regulator of amino acid metabolism with ACT domain
VTETKKPRGRPPRATPKQVEKPVIKEIDADKQVKRVLAKTHLFLLLRKNSSNAGYGVVSIFFNEKSAEEFLASMDKKPREMSRIVKVAYE